MKDMFIADFAYTSVAAFHITLVSMKKRSSFLKAVYFNYYRFHFFEVEMMLPNKHTASKAPLRIIYIWVKI